MILVVILKNYCGMLSDIIVVCDISFDMYTIQYSFITAESVLEDILASNSGFRSGFCLAGFENNWIFFQSCKTKSRIEGLGSRIILNAEGHIIKDAKVSILQRNYTVTVLAHGTVPAAHFALSKQTPLVQTPRHNTSICSLETTKLF